MSGMIGRATEMSLDTDTLERVAQDGEMDYEKWPAILEPLLERLNQIVFEFPTPRPYANVNQPPNQLGQPTITHAQPTDFTPAANGAQVPATPVRPLPPVPAFNSSSTSTSHIPESVPNSQPAPPISQIPLLLQQMLDSISSTLRSCFATKPPHTVQRLAELVLHPHKHYKTLPAWLRAVDRVVAVSSTADIFPLPHAQPLPNSVIDASLLNGTDGDGTGTGTGGGGILWDNSRDRSNGTDAGLGSDESLGGALLTPIPWLKDMPVLHDSNVTDTTVGTDESGDSEMLVMPEREGGAVTQGELIRQEQEAGVVPVSTTISVSPSRTLQSESGEESIVTGAADDDAMVDDEQETDETIPHARGPGIVGTVDMGLVGGRGVEVNIDSGEQRLQKKKTGVVADAQTVLEKGTPALIDGEEEEMQIDVPTATPTTSSKGGDEEGDDTTDAAPKVETDGDVILPDADGKIDSEAGKQQHEDGESRT